MTKPDQFEHYSDGESSRDTAGLKRIGLGMLGGFALLFFPAFAFGFTRARLDQGGLENSDFATLGVAGLLMIAILALVWRFWPAPSNEPEAPNVKKSRMTLYLCMGVGGVMGFLFVIADGPESGMFSNGTINPVIAAILIGIWLILAPLGTLRWLRNVDEHEVGAYRDGAYIAGHAYLFIVPAWWVAARAGWLPAQDPMIAFILFCAIWSVVWFAKRYL